MEELLLRLPKRPQPFLIRFAVTTAVMAVCIGVQLAIARLSGLPGLFILLVGIFAVSTVFDRASGFYATAIGTISAFLIIRHLFPQVPGVPVLVILFCVGIALSVFSEALRLAMERAIAAERETDILFRELAHRMHNNMALAISLLDMQGRAHDNPEVRAALSNAVDRLSILAEGQKQLRPQGAGLVEMQSYLGRICAHLSRSIGAGRAIDFDLAIEPVTVSAEKALVIGLIANELVTNAIKYAFPGDRSGTIAVSFAKDSEKDSAGELVLTVADDGAGCPDDAAEGFGTRLIQGLLVQHGGRAVRQEGRPGCRVEVRIPMVAPTG
jgi:two-component system, sensor histidine kinase PdtaS